ncbi:penicillin-binding protein [Corynebacterium zhongnanshanii]|uniref:Penicillin-binding protein n=1 Tax=Corynebacterium zhongnanshanii TaxID=2768834 RepID=A0ABQ6VE79_9CORY|nr:transglycosylase domain-containing protein [Corynebacterium zhongnanshanii]KAB3522628.1 penicillin-binding protein [Corynebacterium zhongnanshanii]
MKEKLTALSTLIAAILVAGVLMSVALLPLAGAAGWGINASSRTMNSNLQDIGYNTSLPLVSTMTDREGEPIAYFYDQYRVPVASDKISQEVKDSIVAIEDRRFYEHSGVDLRGTLRAMVSNVTSGGVAEGASTLDQQYVKNYLYYIAADSHEQAEEAVKTSIPRKLREMKMASEVDQRFSKDEILTRYLNLISYGQGAFGIEAAARTYFGVHASHLTVPQAAFLAGVVQSTAGLDPYAHPDAALQRRNAVLQARVATGTLSQADADRYAQEPLGVLEQPQRLQGGCIGAGDNGFFCDYALQWLEDHGLSQEDIMRGGYTITTTLDATAQQQAVQQSRLRVHPQAEGVASVSSFITPRSSGRSGSATTHDVRAMASSRVYGLDAESKQTVLPLTHSLQGNGAGSVFKIFDAAVALEHGAGLDTKLDVPKRVEVSGMGDGGAAGCLPGMYCVENAADYRPQLTLREALATSPNTPFVELAQTVGMQRIVDLSVDLGLRSYATKGSFSQGVSIAEQMKKDNNASYVLGPTPINPLELSNVAATLADGGRWCEPRPVVKVTDRDGKPMKLTSTPCQQVLERPVADALANALGEDTVKGSAQGAAQATGFGSPISAKTGTTESNMSAAFVGFTPTWAGSTYIFNDGSTTLPLCTSPARQCMNGDMFGGKEAAETFLATTNNLLGYVGAPMLPPFDPRFLAGTNPHGFREAYGHVTAQRRH